MFIFVSWLFSSESQPVNHGRKLSEWAQEVKFLDPDSRPLKPDDSIRAIQEIGTNAIPYAVRWLSTDPRDKVRRLKAELILRVNQSQKWFHFDSGFESPFHKKRLALGVFAALGTNAVQAIPEIEKLLESDDRYVVEFAALALRSIGKDSIPVLVRSLSSTNQILVEASISALSSFGTNSLRGFPKLMEHLKTDSMGLGDYCAFALLYIAPEAKEFHQAIVARFKSSLPKPSWMICSVIKHLGTNVSELAPDFERLIESNNENMPLKRRLIDVLAGIDAQKAQPHIKLLEEKFRENELYEIKSLRDDSASNAIYFRYIHPLRQTNAPLGSPTN